MTNPTQFDPVSLEIMWSRMLNVAEEMWSTILRTAVSTIIASANDFGCEVLDAEGIRPKSGGYGTRMFSAYGRIIVDGHGLGSGLIDRLREHGYRVEEFLGMRRQKGGKFYNARAVAFWELRELLENERLALEWDPDLVEELLSVEWSTPTGAIQMLPKDKIKQLIGRSPDMADALSQAVFSIPSRQARMQYFRI